MEKGNDTVVRRPHAKDGKLKFKTELMLPPVSEENISGKNNP